MLTGCNCRHAAALAYNSPLAYPQPASTALPMEYGQGRYQTNDAFSCWKIIFLTVNRYLIISLVSELLTDHADACSSF